MHPYTYRHSRIYYHTALAAMVPFAIRLFRDFSYAGLEDALGSALLFAIFFPLFIYFHQLNTSYILEVNQLVIRKWLGKNRTYVYTDLRRAIVRKQEEGHEEAYTLKLQLSDGKKLNLPLSYLNDREPNTAAVPSVQ